MYYDDDDNHFLDAMNYAMAGIDMIPEGAAIVPYVPFAEAQKVCIKSYVDSIAVGIDFNEHYNGQDMKWDFVPEKPKSCTCGVHKTYGKVPLNSHSNWCDLRN